MKLPSFGIIDLAILGILALLVFGNVDGCSLPGLPSTKATAVVYTFDDKQHSAPPPVQAAMDKLNRAGITATLDEVDTTDGGGEVPEQYKVSRPAAVAAGLPALVVMAGEKALKVVKDPRTEEAVLEAAK